MNRNEEQKEREKYIFGEFIEVCPLEIVSFDSKNPPEPDILCQLTDGSSLAFELTEAVDDMKPRNKKKAQQVEELWEEHKNYKLPKSEKERFERIFSGCSLTLTLSDHATDNDIKEAIPLIFEKYKKSCRNQLGLIRYIKSALPKGCESIRIEPKNGEPKFRCSRAIYISPKFVIDRIKSKFDKTYITSSPINLFTQTDRLGGF